MGAWLVVITYLGGASWGPVVTIEQVPTMDICIRMRDRIVSTIDEMSRSNASAAGQTVRGVTSAGRKVVEASCEAKP